MLTQYRYTLVKYTKNISFFFLGLGWNFNQDIPPHASKYVLHLCLHKSLLYYNKYLFYFVSWYVLHIYSYIKIGGLDKQHVIK